MTNPQQTDPSQGDLSQGTADRRNSADQSGAAGGRARNTDAPKAGKAVDRPGSDPKNPGDFGHQ
jgi:hypothetical protein